MHARFDVFGPHSPSVGVTRGKLCNIVPRRSSIARPFGYVLHWSGQSPHGCKRNAPRDRLLGRLSRSRRVRDCVVLDVVSSLKTTGPRRTVLGSPTWAEALHVYS